MYLLKMMDTYKPENGSVADFIRSFPPYRAVHSDFQYMNMQDNQPLHIFEYRDGGIKKMK
jgi:hypothetical protein